MVDDLEVAKRVQAATAVGASPLSFIPPPSQGNGVLNTVSDAVDLSAGARDIVASARQGETIAEAWLRQKIAPADPTDPKTLRQLQAEETQRLGAGKDDTSGEDDSVAAWNAQKSLVRSFDTAIGDIGWLIDALGIGQFEPSRVAAMIAQRAADDGVGSRPSVSTVRLQAEQTGATAALYLENLSLTVQKGKTVDASVGRVALTAIPGAVTDSLTASDRPLVMDVGGELQRIAAGDSDGTASTAQYAQAALQKAAQVAEILQNTTQGKDAGGTRHALLIVREGGRLYPEGTLRLKMDVLQPLT